MTSLSDFALTEVQKQVIRLKEQGLTRKETAAQLGITYNQVRRAVNTTTTRAAKRGWSPDHDMVHPVPDTHLLKGTSTLYGDDGGIKLQWVKSSIDQKRMEEFANAVMESAIETLTPIKPRKKTATRKDSDILVVYPVSDAHIGLYCWEAEAEGNWDCAMAEEVMTEAFDVVLHGSPNSEDALIANLGDWFHTDTPKNVTNESGHQLDVDTKWSKVVSIGLRIMIKLINSALLKHDTVRIINSRGNHDPQSSYMMSMALNAWYRNEPRVVVDMSPDAFHWHEFGQNFFGVHHGHLVRKPEQLYRVMTEDKRVEYGRTLHHHFFLGHIHHHTSVDIGSMRIESFNTVIPRDTYAHSHGYRANRGQQAISYHREAGETSRVQYLIKSK